MPRTLTIDSFATKQLAAAAVNFSDWIRHFL